MARQIYIGPNHSSASTFLNAHRSAKGEPANLLSLAGGTFHLPTDEAWRQLYRAIAQDVRDGKPNFLVQMRSQPNWCLAFDIGAPRGLLLLRSPSGCRLPSAPAADMTHLELGVDFLLDEVLPLLCKGVCAALAVQIRKLRVLVTAGPSTPGKLEDGTPATKSGLHVHVLNYVRPDGKRPAVVVDAEKGELVRAAVIGELATAFPDRQDLRWTDVVDRAVFQANVESPVLLKCCSLAGSASPHLVHAA